MLKKWPKDLEMKIVDNHFIKDHKVDQKINGWSLRWNCSVTVAYYFKICIYRCFQSVECLFPFSPSLLFWPNIRHWIRVKKKLESYKPISFRPDGIMPLTWRPPSTPCWTIPTKFASPTSLIFSSKLNRPAWMESVTNYFIFTLTYLKIFLLFLRHRFDCTR